MRFIYLLRDENDYYKVGVATDVKARLGSIQTGSPARIHIVCTREIENPEALESQLHTYLAQHVANGGREWFKLQLSQALDVCRMIYQPPIALAKPLASGDEYDQAYAIFTQEGRASTSLLQRRMGVGYGRAARIMDELEERGLIGPWDGQHPRRVYTVENDPQVWATS